MTKTDKQTIINIIVDVSTVLVLILLLEIVGFKKGFLIFLGLIAILTVIRLYQNRATFMMTVRYLETLLYGKPLDREFWEKGEKKKLRFKLKWKK